MEFPIDQIEELKKVYPKVQKAEEAGFTYFFLPQLELPNGCSPEQTDALFCPMARDGYKSRMFFSDRIAGGQTRNWNGQARILDRTWWAISWNTTPNQRLIQIIRSHIDAFRT